MRIELNFLKSVDENAAAFFEKAKRQKKKVTGIKVASVSLSSRIQSADTAVSSVALPRSEKRRKREWFEKFRWFFSSDGFLVLGGRDAKSNEQLVKKFLDRDDLFVHADVFGAPHCVIKSDRKMIPLSTKKEAAVFAAVFSRSWEAGSGKADVYAATSEQVSKAAPTGESIGKGAFMVYGEREWFRNVDLRMGIGIESVSDGFRVASGPVSAVSQHCAAWVELAPGTIEKNAVAKQVFFALQKKSNGSFPSGVLDEVLGCLPNGKSRLVEKSGDIHA